MNVSQFEESMKQDYLDKLPEPVEAETPASLGSKLTHSWLSIKISTGLPVAGLTLRPVTDRPCPRGLMAPRVAYRYASCLIPRLTPGLFTANFAYGRYAPICEVPMRDFGSRKSIRE